MNEYNTELDLGLKFPDDRTVDLKSIGNFIKDILSDKINNKKDAEDEYVKKITNDE